MRISLRGYAVVFWMVIQCTGYAQWSNGADYFGHWEYAIDGLPSIDSLRLWGVRQVRVVKDDGDSVSLDYDRKYRLKRVYVHTKKFEWEDRPKYTRENRIRCIRRKANWGGSPSKQHVTYAYRALPYGWIQVIQTVHANGDFHRCDTTEILERDGLLLGIKSRFYGEFLHRIEYLGDTTDFHIQTPQWDYFTQSNDTARFTIRTVRNSRQQPVFQEYIYHHYRSDCGVGMMLSAHWTYDEQHRLIRYHELRGGYDVCYSIDYRSDGIREVKKTCLPLVDEKEEVGIVLSRGEYLWPERILDMHETYRYYFDRRK